MVRALACIGVAAGVLLLSASSVGAQQSEESFLQLDVFGGLVGAGSVFPIEESATNDEKVRTVSNGWDVGTTVFIASRWLGVTGSVGRTRGPRGALYQYLVGPRVTTPYGHLGTRAFAHILLGRAHTRGPDGPMSGSEIIAGGGLDVYASIRLQGDFMRLNVLGLRRNGGRVFLGIVVPLCLRQCGDTDGWPVGKKKR
jgi:hypothetical protein